MAQNELRYLEPSHPLYPSSAAVALILDENGRYLMQLRDDIPSFFSPITGVALAEQLTIQRYSKMPLFENYLKNSLYR